MDHRFSDSVDLFPLLDGDPADTCTRLHAKLQSRRTLTILTVHGEVDAYTQNRWRSMLDIALTAAEESGCLVVDVDDVSFLGCRSVLDLAARARLGATRGVAVSVIDPAPSVLDRVVALTGLTEWLPVHLDLTEMLATGPPRRRACALTTPIELTPRSR